MNWHSTAQLDEGFNESAQHSTYTLIRASIKQHSTAHLMRAAIKQHSTTQHTSMTALTRQHSTALHSEP